MPVTEKERAGRDGEIKPRIQGLLFLLFILVWVLSLQIEVTHQDGVL